MTYQRLYHHVALVRVILMLVAFVVSCTDSDSSSSDSGTCVTSRRATDLDCLRRVLQL